MRPPFCHKMDSTLQYPSSCGSKAKVVSVVDLTVGYDSKNPPDFTPVSELVCVCVLKFIIVTY